MAITWIVVANRVGTRIFENRGPGKGISLVDTLENPEGRLQNREINSDRPGRLGENGSHQRHTADPQESPHEHIAVNFAKRVARELNSARTSDRYQRLVLVAEPHFLGLLRSELDHSTETRVTGSLAKDLAEVDERGITERLQNVIAV